MSRKNSKKCFLILSQYINIVINNQSFTCAQILTNNISNKHAISLITELLYEIFF